MRNVFSDFSQGLSVCLKQRRLDFFLLAAFVLLVPTLMVFMATSVSGEEFSISQFSNSYVIGLFLFISALTLSKPLMVFYGEVLGNATFVKRLDSCTNHFVGLMFAVICLDLHYNGEANDNALFTAIAILIFSTFKLILFIARLVSGTLDRKI